MAHNGTEWHTCERRLPHPTQTAALPYIAAEPNLVRGARAAQVGRRTLMRWLNDPAFRAELERIRENIADLAYTELEGSRSRAYMRLDQLLDDPTPTSGTARSRPPFRCLSTSATSATSGSSWKRWRTPRP